MGLTARLSSMAPTGARRLVKVDTVVYAMFKTLAVQSIVD
jgi:hypothetical protein